MDAELLTVAKVLQKHFVEWPRNLVALIRCYVPIEPEPSRKCSIQLFNQIDFQLGPCWGFCTWLRVEYGTPGSYVNRLLSEESPEVFEAISEYAHALERLKEAIDQLQSPPPADLSESATEEQLDGWYRWPIPPLKLELLTDVERTVNGVEILLEQCRRSLEQEMEESGVARGEAECSHELIRLHEKDKVAGGEPAEQQQQETSTDEDDFQEIMSLKGLWQPVFCSYKRLVAALEKSGIVSQHKQGRRRKVHVAQFARWITAMKSIVTRGFDPNDRGTWTEEMWSRIASEFDGHKNIMAEIREEKKRRNTES
jgi:hypothetical protein